tara:strand:+ start:555 stop:749 length:195 start_codon:yes stop_codon:yes gene_type:complete
VADLTSVDFAILDEADEMLNMGFSDAVDSILAAISKGNTIRSSSYCTLKVLAQIVYFENISQIV